MRMNQMLTFMHFGFQLSVNWLRAVDTQVRVQTKFEPTEDIRLSVVSQLVTLSWHASAGSNKLNPQRIFGYQLSVSWLRAVDTQVRVQTKFEPTEDIRLSVNSFRLSGSYL
jgi:hypothetical protein